MVNNTFDNETEVLHKISNGDQQAFCELFNCYQRFVYSFASKLTHSEDLAEEIVQDIFLKIWLNRKKLAELDNFGAYLNRVVRNHSFNVLRQLSQEAKLKQQIGLLLTDVDDNTQHQLNYKESRKILDEALRNLPDKQRTAYRLCHEQGLKYQEAALQMHISSETVHYHLKLATQSIKEHFRKNAGIYPVLMACLYLS
ncbi:RNA polymerase sigma-70 factor [Pedobacter sp. MC2016-14]|uniref:RNA polymerase sigma factor n=1 Tax=Pedobacter sp. MC2016-14 TaxID=2897327 RepID=UPI001E509944|nr:RNA polymerase sigma-70 factor [Pedobacter sp. MC2016-14]MCD0490403.1 RNA polymerase sigma-70 factor [Pedobacter sp. MC2016-14]